MSPTEQERATKTETHGRTIQHHAVRLKKKTSARLTPSPEWTGNYAALRRIATYPGAGAHPCALDLSGIIGFGTGNKKCIAGARRSISSDKDSSGLGGEREREPTLPPDMEHSPAIGIQFKKEDRGTQAAPSPESNGCLLYSDRDVMWASIFRMRTPRAYWNRSAAAFCNASLASYSATISSCIASHSRLRASISSGVREGIRLLAAGAGSEELGRVFAQRKDEEWRMSGAGTGVEADAEGDGSGSGDGEVVESGVASVRFDVLFTEKREGPKNVSATSSESTSMRGSRDCTTHQMQHPTPTAIHLHTSNLGTPSIPDFWPSVKLL
ncbi:hypothetical protein FB45DRAFT_1000537 [Roridomyces roridus]|uniref:Uncharacterized protein n=1 Tax=Roridomyces roridus TaxID=1738132 RepID=A0AAD7C9N2_9AGAR|nr:hypothetical protein FB45DRAFT_1000537 [Roridomyces roridus]